MNTREIGDTTYGFCHLNILSVNTKLVGVMAGAVEMLDVVGIGAGNPQLGRLKNPLTSRYGIRLKQTKL
jgi:hypothetical protein